MQINTAQALSIIAKCIQARLVPLLKGSPGAGKSSIVHALADQYKLKVIDLRLSQCDPTDLMGFPSVTGKRAGYLPMETFPIEGDEIPAGYEGWLLFLDEFTSAATAVQAAAYKLVLDRMVGLHKLHKNVAIVCAGNLETDGAIVNEMSTAMQSRLVHFELVSDLSSFLDWAYAQGIDHRITSYLKFKPGNLYAFKPDHTDDTYACNRTWEFADRILKVTEDGDADRLPMLAGALGEGVGREFIGFMKIDQELPTIPQIVASPATIAVPLEPSILYAITGAIGHNATKDNLGPLIQYVNRLPKEFQVVTLREVVRRKKDLMAHPDLQKWIGAATTALF